MPGMSEMGIFETIYSDRAIRRFKPDPVPDTVISKILDAAIRTPQLAMRRTGCSLSLPMPPNAKRWARFTAEHRCRYGWCTRTMRRPRI